jgi:glucuronokinase
MDKKRFHHLFIAYRTDLSEGSEVVHNNFRERYEFGDQEVLKSVKEWADLTDKGKAALENQDYISLAEYINRNFDIRRSVMNISKANIRMVELARSAGASAKFTGSGGAIIGTYDDEQMFGHLKQILGAENIEVIKPMIV